MTANVGSTYGLYRDNDAVRITAYLIFDHGITVDNLAFNVTIFMRDVDSIVTRATQAGATPFNP